MVIYVFRSFAAMSLYEKYTCPYLSCTLRYTFNSTKAHTYKTTVGKDQTYRVSGNRADGKGAVKPLSDAVSLFACSTRSGTR